MKEMILKVMETIDKVTESHPVLLFFILIAVVLIVVWIKSLFDEKKGINSPEKQRVREILQKVMQEQEDYNEFIPVYAYRRRSSRRSVTSWHYAISLTQSRMYVAPLIFGDKEIGHGKTVVISKEQLSKIDAGKPGDALQFLKFYDNNQEVILEVVVEEKNTKLDKSYPVNIVQIEEARAFVERIRQWDAQKR